MLNAGVMTPPEGSKTQNGHELQMGTNCLGGYLFMRSLKDVLVSTARSSQKGSVRVIWLASTLQIGTPKGGIIWVESKTGPKSVSNQMENYMMIKVGNVFLARETAKRLGLEGVLSMISLSRCDDGEGR